MQLLNVKRSVIVQCGLLILGCLIPVVLMASETAYIKTDRDDVRALSFKSFSGWTEIFFRGNSEKADEYKIRETLLSPRLSLSTKGSIYHHKFLTFDLNGIASLEQHRAWGGNAKSDLLSFNDYDVSFLFLRDRPTNLNLFAHRTNSWVDSPFRASYRVLSSSQGAEFRVVGVQVPLSVAYNRQHREEEVSGVDRIEDQDQFSVNLRNRLKLLENILSFRYVDYARNLQFQDYRTLNTSWNTTLHFKKNSRGGLRSSVRYFHQYGTIRRRDFSIFENLFFNPTKHLENGFNYQYTEQGSRNPLNNLDLLQLNRSHHGAMSIRHTLYGSLVTSLQFYGSYEDFMNDTGGVRERVGEDKQRGLRGDLSYRRKTVRGRLFLGYGLDLAHEKQYSSERSRDVANEQQILVDGNEPQLEHAGVDSSSVVVTDETGFIVYVEGVDYTLVRFGNFTRIFRVPGGNIANSQIILVDYTYIFTPELAFNTRGHRASFRFDTNRDISIFYRYNRSKEDFISGIPNGFLEDHRRHLAGVKLKAGRFSFGEEYEVNRYLAAKFVSNRLRADFDSRLGMATRIHISGSYSLTRFSDLDRSLNIYTLNSRLLSMLPGRINLEAEGWIRIDRGNRKDPGLESDFSGLRLKLSKNLRAMQITLGAFYRKADDNQVQDERANLFVAIRRNF